jgi:hypothetical protein
VTTISPSFNLKTVCPPFLGMGTGPPSGHRNMKFYDTGNQWEDIYLSLGYAYPDMTAPFPY